MRKMELYFVYLFMPLLTMMLITIGLTCNNINKQLNELNQSKVQIIRMDNESTISYEED